MTHHNQVLYITGCNLMLPEDAQRKGRSSPLDFLLFRCPADKRKEGVIYNMAVDSIKLLPEGERVLLVFYEILRQYGGNKIAALRGWLVNHHLKVASAAEVAQTIGFRHKTAMVGGALKQLVKAGLLEWRDPPDFQENLRKDKQVEVVPREPRKRDLLESGKFGQADNRPDGREAAALENRQADDRSQGREADSDDRPDGREGLANEGKAQRHGRQTRKTVLPSDGLPGPPDTGRKVSGKFPDTFRGTSHARLETGDGKRETGDERRETPPAAPASAAPPPLPLSAHRLRQTGNEKPASAPAAPSPSPLDGETKDAPTADAPAVQGMTADEPTGNEPTLATQATQSPPGGLQETAKTADGLSPTVNAEPGTGQPPSADDALADGGDQAQSNGQPAEPPEPTKADPGPGSKPGPGVGLGRDMSWHSERVAKQVLMEMYPTQEDLVLQGRRARPSQSADEFRRRELACLAGCLSEGLMGLSSAESMKLIDVSLKKAGESKRRKCRSTRGRWWVYWFHEHVNALRRERKGQ